MFEGFETPRLILKNISKDDRDFIYKQFSDDIINKYLFDAEPLTDIGGADEIIDFYLQPEPRLQHRWILIRKTDGIKMGTCGFHCWNKDKGIIEVGYDLQEAFWGNGYMQEAMNEIISFAIENMNINEINAVIYVDNKSSISLAEKLGFKFYGIKRNEVFRGKCYLHYIYSLHRLDYKHKNITTFTEENCK